MFAAGGWYAQAVSLNHVEIYSPNGKCQKVLAPLPVTVEGLYLVFFEGSVVACAGNLNKVDIEGVLYFLPSYIKNEA